MAGEDAGQERKRGKEGTLSQAARGRGSTWVEAVHDLIERGDAYDWRKGNSVQV
jgi:hypothetical protein